ncbi:hypothetical protein [Mycobacterium kansasii]|uniref:hypothetical protein n=1 Tax=Mycobacterium kansasii TaxID=1768 RepID=UPI00115A4EE6|nr:hypothetical protein [Mycobacterium kansasii]
MVLQLSVLSQLTAAMAANVAISAATTIRTARDRLLIAFIGHAFQLLLCRYADSDDDCLQMLCRRFPRRAVFNGSGLRNIKTRPERSCGIWAGKNVRPTYLRPPAPSRGRGWSGRIFAAR